MMYSKTLRLPVRESNLRIDLPKELSVSFDALDVNRLSVPEDLFDPEVPFNNSAVLSAITPLLVISSGNDSYEIIDGCKRFYQSRNRFEKMLCAVIQAKLSPVSHGLVRLICNQSRPFHIREKFLITCWIKKMLPDIPIQTVLLQFGIPAREIEYLEQLQSSNDITKNAVFDNQLDLSLISYFKILSEHDQQNYLKTFFDFNLSFQTQREFLEWLPEIAYLKKTTVTEILNSPDITEILGNQELNPPQKIHKIHACLFCLKYPRFSEVQKSWKKHADTVNPDPKKVSFLPEPFFENSRLELKITLTNPDEAKSIFKQLNDLSSEHWQKLINPAQ